MTMFNSRYIPFKIISKQAAIIVSHSRLLRFISKQAAIMVSHSHHHLFVNANILPRSLKPLFSRSPFSTKSAGILSINSSVLNLLLIAGKVLTGFRISTHTLSSDRSIRLAKKLFKVTFSSYELELEIKLFFISSTIMKSRCSWHSKLLFSSTSGVSISILNGLASSS